MKFSLHLFWYLSVMILSALGLSACSGSKQYSKKAAKMEEAGLIRESANYYFMAAQHNPKNVDALIGLKKTGQQVIEKDLDKFFKAYSVKNDKEAVYLYRGVVDFREQCKPYVLLEVPPYYTDHYKEMLDLYLERIYQKASDLMYNEKFEQAEVIFNEILRLNPAYKDVSSLGKIAKIEPIYRKGIVAFESGKYRTCYSDMSLVLREDAAYKDAIDYKTISLEKGRMVVAVLNIDYQTSLAKKISELTRLSIIKYLTKSNNPFITVLDRANTDDLQKEQNFNASLESGNGFNTGELLGANTLVKARVLSYQQLGGSIKKYTKKGFEAYLVKKINPDTKQTYSEKRYRKIVYYEYKGSVEVVATLSYQVISAETGEVLFANVEDISALDRVNYATYSGNYRNIIAGNYKKRSGPPVQGDVLYDSPNQIRQLHEKFTAKKRTLRPVDDLINEAAKQLGGRISISIEQYNPDE